MIHLEDEAQFAREADKNANEGLKQEAGWRARREPGRRESAGKRFESCDGDVKQNEIVGARARSIPAVFDVSPMLCRGVL